MRVEDWLGENNTLGMAIYNKKYRNNNETFDEFLDRVSNHNVKIKNLILENKFLFGGRILSNRGIEGKGITYSNCYVIAPPEDSIEDIYKSRYELARTYSYGGGCGIDISKLAPKGAKVNNQANETSGAVSFMEGYSQTTAEIGQAGRRGALMISLDCTHPDLEDFIQVKTKDGAVTKANISIKVTDEFMKAVEEDKDWKLSFTRKETGETIEKTIRAKEVFRMLSESNYNWAEPGILYWDTISNYNLLDKDPEFQYEGVNPCAEEPLPAYGSCLLGSINLGAFVKYSDIKNKPYFDYGDFERTIRMAVDAMNDVLDEGMNKHPLSQQRECVSNWRQIGLGVMGLADAFIKMNLTYGSEESVDFLDEVGKFLAYYAIDESAELAKIHGSYPKYNSKVLDSTFFIAHADENLRNKVAAYGLRNSQLLTCAPTGSIATMLNISNGIEPLFQKSWTRKTESLHGEEVYYTESPKIIKDYLAHNPDKNIDNLPECFIVSHEIKPIKRIKIQGTLQKHIDASISSTINLPESTTIDEIEDIYFEAWKKKLKGVTIYRNNCNRTGVLTTDNKKNIKVHKLGRGDIISTSNNAIGLKRKLMTGCGSLHCTAFFDADTGELTEAYLSKGSTGGCNNFMIGLSRMISLAARGGIRVCDIVDQLNSCGACPSYAVRSATKHDTSKGSCCPMAVGNALKDMHEEILERMEELNENPQSNKTSIINSTIANKISKNPCPNCGEELIYEGGCNICKGCGWTKCD